MPPMTVDLHSDSVVKTVSTGSGQLAKESLAQTSTALWGQLSAQGNRAQNRHLVCKHLECKHLEYKNLECKHPDCSLPEQWLWGPQLDAESSSAWAQKDCERNQACHRLGVAEPNCSVAEKVSRSGSGPA